MIVLVRRLPATQDGGAVATTRERIIQASSALFMERGYSASGLKQISAASDAPIGSLYHFFPGGKEELAAETLRTSGAAYQLLVETVFDTAPDIVTGVRDCFDGAAEVLRVTDYADACPIATVALEVASSDERLRQVTADIFESWLESAARRLERGGVEPSRARALATVLVAALEGGFLLSRAAKDTSAMDAIGAAMVELVEGALVT
jgi:AcrR family transcriptional regulator